MSNASVLFDAPGPRARTLSRVLSIVTALLVAGGLLWMFLVLNAPKESGGITLPGMFDESRWDIFADPELWEVVERGIWDRVPAGASLVREGERGDFFCVLVDGEMRVTKNKKLLTVLGPGECFGEMAYLSERGHERGATVTAAKDSRIVSMRIADLDQASVSCRSKFDRAFIGILVERLNLANTRLTSA